MALPSSGAISMADIRDEFGDTNPTSLTEFYAGAGKVPIGAQGALGIIPSAGLISLGHFLGSSGSLLTGARWKKRNTAVMNLVEGNGTVSQFKQSQVLQVQEAGGEVITLNYIEDVPLYQSGHDTKVSYAGGSFWGSRYLSSQSANTLTLSRSYDGISWFSRPSYPQYAITTTSTHWNTWNGVCGGTLYGAPLLLMLVASSYQVGTWYNTLRCYISSDYFETCSAVHIINEGGVASAGQFAGKLLWMPGAAAGTQLGGDGAFMYVAETGVFRNNYFTYTSPSGTSWTPRNLKLPNSSVVTLSTTTHKPIASMVFQDKFIAFTPFGKLIYSLDGITYTYIDSVVLPNAATSGGYILCCTSDEYCIAVYKNTLGGLSVAASTDGLSWSTVTSLDLAPLSLSVGASLVQDGSYWYLSAGSLWYVPI